MLYIWSTVEVSTNLLYTPQLNAAAGVSNSNKSKQSGFSFLAPSSSASLPASSAATPQLSMLTTSAAGDAPSYTSGFGGLWRSEFNSVRHKSIEELNTWAHNIGRKPIYTPVRYSTSLYCTYIRPTVAF